MSSKFTDKNMEYKPADENGICWYDYSEPGFKMYGLEQYNEVGMPFTQRIPQDTADSLIGVVNPYSAAGGRLRFATDAEKISIKATFKSLYSPSIMALSSGAGFDIYKTNADGSSEFLCIFRPPTDIEAVKTYTSTVETQAKGKMTGYTINFPILADITELKIGVEDGAKIQDGVQYVNEGKPIVFYGSSITHGASASRPGMTYESQISAKYNCDFVNLGFAGHAKGEETMAEYIAGLDMCAFVCDYDYNAPDKAHLEKTHYRFYEIIREKNPDLPYIMISKPNLVFFRDEDEPRREVIKNTFEKAKQKGDRNVYFIDGEWVAALEGDALRDICDGFVDGAHPNDLGFSKMAKNIGRVLADILNLSEV